MHGMTHTHTHTHTHTQRDTHPQIHTESGALVIHLVRSHNTFPGFFHSSKFKA